METIIWEELASQNKLTEMNVGNIFLLIFNTTYLR